MKNDILMVIDQEIKWCKENDADNTKELFVDGLEKAKFLIEKYFENLEQNGE